MLETNRYLLDNGHDNSAQVKAEGFVVIPPVHIHPTAQITRSVIGPHATIAAGCVVEDSIVRDSILDEGAVVQGALLAQSLIGRDARVGGRFRAFNVGEASEVGFESGPAAADPHGRAMTRRVECYSGVEYAERPTAFEWEGRRLEVETVLAQWRTPEGRRFRVRVRDGQTFELTYVKSHDEWQIHQL